MEGEMAKVEVTEMEEGEAEEVELEVSEVSGEWEELDLMDLITTLHGIGLMEGGGVEEGIEI